MVHMNLVEKFIVENDESGARIDQFITSRKGSFSRKLLSSLCENGHVSCNGKTVLKKYKKVETGDEVTVDAVVDSPENNIVEAERIPLDIIYEVFTQSHNIPECWTIFKLVLTLSQCCILLLFVWICAG
jgi:ribosomal 50S subunit-recycling heat shock protein